MKIKSLVIVLGIFLVFPQLAEAQYFAFGKNRVQYETFDWRFIQSEHFDIYYPGSKNYELAEFTAISLEAAYKQIKEDFNHEITNRIPVIVYDSHNDFSQTNVVPLPIDAESIGGVTDKYKNRITIPFDGEYVDFRRTLQHELVHAVFNDMFYGGTVQSIMRNNIQLIFPDWFEEGLAEYIALGWDTNTDMFVRDAVINNYLPPIPRLSGYYAYRGGQSVWNYIAEEYGREKIAEILQRIKITRSIEAGFVEALGLTVQELSEAWMSTLKERYYPEVAEREAAKDIATLVTKRGKFGSYNTSPAISPQGDKIAFITNKRGYFDIVVISAVTGEKLKTLIRGEDNPEFEELNLLSPNLTWSPDGSKVAVSTKSKGRDDLAIIEYETGKVKKIEFPRIDAIGSVAWSPDNTKIAFDANIGPYQDIFVYELESKKLTNLTRDFFTDLHPEWNADSKSIFFTSDRGDKVKLGTYTTEYNQLGDPSLYQTDLYQVRLNASEVIRLTSTPEWDEKSPRVTRDGRLVFISDRVGIQNIYQLNLETRTSTPLTNLQSGVSQHSISADGSRIAFNSINEGYLDIFLFKSPFQRAKEKEPELNYWAKRRAQESQWQRVPATMYAKNIAEKGIAVASEEQTVEEDVQAEEKEKKEKETGEIEVDIRNYVFSDEVMQDSTLVLEDIDTFKPKGNITSNGKYQPRDYRLKFSTDIVYNPSIVASSYGSYALTQFVVSDLLGDHQIAFGTNFVFDLRNSDYSLQYGYLKNRMNYFATYFHSSRQYQTFYGEVLRFRTFGGGISMQYPINKFKRVDFGLTAYGIARDYNVLDDRFSGASVSPSQTTNESSLFLFPEVTFTNDRTLQGFITPRGGNRYSISLTGSPGVGDNAPLFASVLGDYRKYFNLGYNYSVAIRGSGAVSLGRDSQTYFMGGRLGWINQRYNQNGLSFDKLTDNFFTVPALPLRGYEYNSIYGDKFALVNTEFRFPLFAALVPGAIPILPLYNITGAAFVDVGTAWGQRIDYSFGDGSGRTYQIVDANGNSIDNAKGIDFQVAKRRTTNMAVNTQNPSDVVQLPNTFSYLEGDILVGAGFGLRTILLGLPFRYDIAWAYDRSGFAPGAIHYFSIGIDF